MAHLFEYKFDGRQGQRDVGWGQARWYDEQNAQIPIDHLDGTPTHWLFWQAEGQSYYADDQYWNSFKSPEQRFTWAEFLPPHEHATLLNDIGQSYNWFHSAHPFHSRIARPTLLPAGEVTLQFEFFADWYKWEGYKRPLSQLGDPNHARIEMHLIDTGFQAPFNWEVEDEGVLRHQQGILRGFLESLPGLHDKWQSADPSVGHTVLSQTLTVPRSGLYLCVFGVYTVWAVPEANGRNGLFVHKLAASSQAGPTGPDKGIMPITVPPPAAGSSPSDGRGQPRTQYERTYQLIHHTVPEAKAAQIFLQGFRQGKTTGTSADDAGLGALDVKIVEVYGWPTTEQTELLSWFNTHYPGTQLKFVLIP